MEKYKRNSVFTKLKPFCSFAREDDFIEVTDWKNGEGYDVNINSPQGNLIFQMTWGEFKALKKLIKQLDNA